MLAVDLVVEAAHRLRVELPFKRHERTGSGGALRAEVAARDDRRVVRRKEAMVVVERDKAERVDQAVGGIAGDKVDLSRSQGAVGEAEVHRAWRLRELEAGVPL